MARLLLGPLLRYVSGSDATIWVETSERCTVEIAGVRTPTFSVHGHHYALVVLTGLEPGAVIPYDVRLDDAVAWPTPGSSLPPPVIRTLRKQEPVSVRFGSCRMTAPHVEPYVLRPDEHNLGCGIDSLRALGLQMLAQDIADWPEVLLFLGDQVYADNSSPRTARQIARERSGLGDKEPPAGVVAGFEEYCLLYQEAWTPEIERWVLSVVPSMMIFDDHEMIDDWNISAEWVRQIRTERWWTEHVVGGLVSYWVYQHLGNLSPRRLIDEGMLETITRLDDATEYLRTWARASESFTPVPGGYHFSFDRHIGGTHVIVMDTRNGRVLEPRRREMVDAAEWRWIAERAMEPAEHLVLASSLPVFAPGGLHGLQQWNEAVCDGERGTVLARFGEWLRRALDLEHWAAFDRSFRRIERLLIDAATDTTDHIAPTTITVCGGDIHFSFVVDVEMPATCRSVVRQAICSPLRNNLPRRDQQALRFAVTRAGRWIGRQLLRHARRPATRLRWELHDAPIFRNNIGLLHYDGPLASLEIDVAEQAPDGTIRLEPAIRIGGESPCLGEPARLDRGALAYRPGAADTTQGRRCGVSSVPGIGS